MTSASAYPSHLADVPRQRQHPEAAAFSDIKALCRRLAVPCGPQPSPDLRGTEYPSRHSKVTSSKFYAQRETVTFPSLCAARQQAQSENVRLCDAQ